MRTNTVLAIFVAIVIIFAALAPRVSQPLYLPLYLAAVVIEMWLVVVLLGNAIVSSLIVPAQLTSKAPSPWIQTLLKMGFGPEFRPWADGPRMELAFKHAFPQHYQSLLLLSADGTKLSAGLWNNPDGPDPAGPPAQQRWVVAAMPNGQQYETTLFEYAKFAAAASCSLLMFNYRGVGRSEGAALTAAELVTV